MKNGEHLNAIKSEKEELVVVMKKKNNAFVLSFAF